MNLELMEIEEIQELMERYQIGDYIRKYNFAVFNLKTEYGTKIELATEEVKSINFHKKKNELIINGKPFVAENPPVVITKDEAIALEKHWHKILNANFRLGSGGEWEHIREDNGQEKVSLGTHKNACRVLFQYQNIHPNDNYEVYICTQCGEFHLGKKK